jgi:hypothetical protein
MRIVLLIFLAAWPASAQTNSAARTNQTPSLDRRAADIRNACINGRRAVCGKVIKILPDGLVVDSGYTGLLEPPFNQSWVVTGGASLTRDSKAIELNKPASACIGLVFLTDIPKRPAVKPYDYVVIQAYPAGQYTYTPVADVRKTLRKFSAGLDTAIKLNLEAGEK